MKQKSIFPKVIMDMFSIQFAWAWGFFGIMLVINIIKVGRTLLGNDSVDGYYDAVFIGANIFMLVIGIISTSFLSHYVANGVTRKDYFKGALLASVGLSVVIPIIAFVVDAIERFIVTNLTNITFGDPGLNAVTQEIAEDIGDIGGIGDVISTIVQSVIFTPYIDPGSNWILAMGVFSLNIFLYYLLGWLISASFYRFDTVTGLGFIVIALVLLMAGDTLLRVTLGLPLLEGLAALNAIPAGVAALGVLFIVVVSIWMIRLLTKNVSVKM
ncbi:hypothetical protein KFZ56_01585 [Virgibacillus sp. NKC19-3]|uniref:hypothetical protein n=1 Tax=Virgibacillus saliphilus TaxID=2831674 RepID=UPI001C9A43F5|nr:hypothetical protein [Virgibacillus sp. NKC19-3]MBY7141806.1 hypothetical protein [Virgibacillus sp. NKC19-3]